MKKELEISEAINKSLFLLGAGFSYGTGCKISSEMFKSLKTMLLSEENNVFNKTQKEALKFLIACLQYHNEWRTIDNNNNLPFSPNIEELALLIRRIKNRENFLPYPITGNWADKLIQLESEFKKDTKNKNESLFESLDRLLKDLLKNDWLKISSDSSLTYLTPLLELFQATKLENYLLDVFTLNNDLVIETFFKRHHQIPWRGFVRGKWRGILRPDQDDKYGLINLYKLHGSIDWIRLEDMDVWEEEKLFSEPENSLLVESIEDEKQNPYIHNPYVIFGQGTKTFSIEPFFSQINHFNSQLNSKDKQYFFVIGYSFFDPYINNLLFNAARDSKKLIIVNPYFGPDGLKQIDGNGLLREKPMADPDNFFLVSYPPEKNKSILIDYLQQIQKNSFFSELPEFNYANIRGENIEYIPLETDKFIKEFFGNQGRLFKSLIEKFDQENEAEKPF